MPSEDSIYNALSPINSAGCELSLRRSDIVEWQDDSNEPNHSWKMSSLRQINRSSTGASSGANSQRKRQVPNELSKAKGKSTKKGHRTFDIGEPSETSPQPEPKREEKSVKELIKKISAAKVLKILRDRVNRWIKNDNMADRESCICLMRLAIEHQVSYLFSPIVHSLNKVKGQWAARSDLEGIKTKIKEMEVEERDKEKQPEMRGKVMEETIQRLEQIDQKIKRSDDEWRKDSAKANKLDEIFTTEGVSVETLRERLSSAFPWLFLEEIATNEPATGQVQGQSLQNRKQFSVKDLEDLEKKLFDKDHCKVGFSNFPGLQDAINAAEGNIPDYLKSIAKKIEDDRGEPTPDAYQGILVLLSAAVKEMEDLPADELNGSTLSKWGATFNQAKRMQFEVRFVETLLKKNIYAYFSYSGLKAG